MKKNFPLFAIIAGLIAFCNSARADAPSELTVKRTETIDPTTGLKCGVMEEFTRNGTNVVRIISIYKQGKLTSSSRFTYAFGRKVLQEGDEDGDGFYELRIITTSDDPKSVEVFHVQKDGLVKPVSAAKLKEFREYAVKQEEIGEFMRAEIEKAKREQSEK